MNRLLVIDASVAIKWLVPEEGSEFALSIVEQEFSLVAPDLLLSEIGNVLWKKSRSKKITSEAAIRLLNGFQNVSLRLIPSIDIASVALGIAQRYDRSYYDSLYLALANTFNAPVVTADRKFWNALQTTPYKDKVILLGMKIVA